MHRGLLIMFLSLVHNARTKFVEIDVPMTSTSHKNAAYKQAMYQDDVVDNFRRHHQHKHHKDHSPGRHHSLHSIENNSPFIKSIRNLQKIPALEDALPPSVVEAEKRYHDNMFKYGLLKNRDKYRRQNDPVPVFHLYGKHGHGDSRRFYLKEAQHGLSSQDREHPGNSLFYLPGNPILGAAKFPKRKQDEHSVYGNLQTLGLINVAKQLKEARAKNRPRSRPPDASKQPHLLFDPNHPGMTLVHPEEQLILGYAKFSKPSESSHRVYGNDYSIGLRSRDKTQPLRFQYSGFRRNLDNKRRKERSANPSNDNAKHKPRKGGLILPYFFSGSPSILSNSRKMNGGFSKVRYNSPRDKNHNLDELSYRSLILRSGQSNEEDPPWRLPINIPKKLIRQQQRQAKKHQLRNQKHQKTNEKPGWVFVLRNGENSVRKFNKTKQPLRNRQTLPPWVKLIEKDSKEQGKLKASSKNIPPEKLVYGHIDNFGIRYGNTPYRVKYSDFRKSSDHHDSAASEQRKWDGTIRSKKKIQVIQPYSAISFDSDINPVDYRRLHSDPVLKFNQKAKSYNKMNKQDTQKIVDAVMKAIKDSNDKNQHLYKRGQNLAALAAIRPSDFNAKRLKFRPLNAFLNDPVSKNSIEMEINANEINSSEEGHDINYRRSSKKSDKHDSFETILHNCTVEKSSSTSSSSSDEKNPGNPYTIFKNKYKQNWLWNHFMDGDHMNVNPYGPQFDPLGPSGTELFFGRKWWYFNQDDYRPFRRR